MSHLPSNISYWKRGRTAQRFSRKIIVPPGHKPDGPHEAGTAWSRYNRLPDHIDRDNDRCHETRGSAVPPRSRYLVRTVRQSPAPHHPHTSDYRHRSTCYRGNPDQIHSCRGQLAEAHRHAAPGRQTSFSTGQSASSVQGGLSSSTQRADRSLHRAPIRQSWSISQGCSKQIRMRPIPSHD